MKTILEYLSVKVKPTIIHADNKSIREIVKSEIDRLGNIVDLNHIDVSKVTNFDGLFSTHENETPTQPKRLGKKYININPDISKWNTINATNFDSMFLGCKKFNCDLSDWQTENVTIMSYMFCLCEEFNSDLSKWDLTDCTRINGMFSYALKFNSDISGWKTDNIWDMEYTFNEAKSFNQDLSGWNVKKVHNHADCFKGCSKQWTYNRRPKLK